MFKDNLFTPTETTGVPVERLQPNPNWESDEIQDGDNLTPENAQEEHQFPTIPLGCRIGTKCWQNRFHHFLSPLEQEINAKVGSINCPQQEPHVKPRKEKSVQTDLAERRRAERHVLQWLNWTLKRDDTAEYVDDDCPYL